MTSNIPNCSSKIQEGNPSPTSNFVGSTLLLCLLGACPCLHFTTLIPTFLHPSPCSAKSRHQGHFLSLENPFRYGEDFFCKNRWFSSMFAPAMLCSLVWNLLGIGNRRVVSLGAFTCSKISSPPSQAWTVYKISPR